MCNFMLQGVLISETQVGGFRVTCALLLKQDPDQLTSNEATSITFICHRAYECW